MCLYLSVATLLLTIKIQVKKRDTRLKIQEYSKSSMILLQKIRLLEFLNRIGPNISRAGLYWATKTRNHKIVSNSPRFISGTQNSWDINSYSTQMGRITQMWECPPRVWSSRESISRIGLESYLLLEESQRIMWIKDQWLLSSGLRNEEVATLLPHQMNFTQDLKQCLNMSDNGIEW